MKADIPEYWKTVVDTMMDGVIVVDGEGTIVSINKALERITGYSAAELVGQDCLILDCDTCFSENRKGKRERQCPLLWNGSVVRHRCSIRRKDGSLLYTLKNGALLRDAGGDVVGGVETLTDITDLVAKEQTIKE